MEMVEVLSQLNIKITVIEASDRLLMPLIGK